MILNDLDNFYLALPEPTKSCMLALRNIILGYNKEIQAAWKYRLPFFVYNKKNLCYLWKDKNTKHPYIGFPDGNKIDHPLLIQGDRKRMKILPVDPNNDIPIEIISEILSEIILLNK